MIEEVKSIPGEAHYIPDTHPMIPNEDSDSIHHFRGEHRIITGCNEIYLRNKTYNLSWICKI